MPYTPDLPTDASGTPAENTPQYMFTKVLANLTSIATLLNAIETALGIKLAGDAAQEIAGSSASALLRLRQNGTGPSLSIADDTDAETFNINPDGSTELGDMPTAGLFETGYLLRLIGGVSAVRAMLLASLGDDATGFDLNFYKSRSLDGNTRDSVANSDRIGRIIWRADAGASDEDAAAIVAEVDGTILEASTISTITRTSNTVTVVFTAAHSFAMDDVIAVSNVPKASFNGNFSVLTIPNSTTITYYQLAVNDSDTAGSVAKRNMPSRIVFYTRLANATALREVFRIDKDGLLTIQAGIKFPAANLDSADANALDDYEEGLFTPTMYGLTTAGSGTYSTQNGRYQKVGNRVHFEMALAWTAHTGTGFMRIAGLPFIAAGVSAVAMTVSSLTYTGTSVHAAVVTGADEIALYNISSGAGETGISMDTSVSLRISGTYRV